MKKHHKYIGIVLLGLAALTCTACGDDTSSGPSEQSSAREVSMSFKGCYESLSRILLKESSENLPKAYLYHENDKYQVMIPKLDDYCGFADVKLDVNRFGDTLSVDVKSIIPTKCMCVSDHWFDIEARDADIKYFAFSPKSSGKTVYEVVPGPAPE